MSLFFFPSVYSVLVYHRYKYVKLVTLVEDNPKAPFSAPTTQRYRGERSSIPWTAPFYCWSSPYNAECLAKQHQVPFFESLESLNLGLNPSLPDHRWTLLIRPMVLSNIFSTHKQFKRAKPTGYQILSSILAACVRLIDCTIQGVGFQSFL